MKIKESYTLEELCSSLTITLTKFCQMSGITEGTLIRLRQGYAGRASTINSILATFSQIYGIEFSQDNVTGLTLQEKPHQKSKKQPSVKPAKPVIEKPQKRAYTPRKTDLPEGYMLATDFAKQYGVAYTTLRDHMLTGLGPGLIHGPDVSEDGSVPVKDYIKSEERIKRTRFDKDGKEVIERERYLTPEQQAAALEFWKRHGVEFGMLD